MPITRAKIADIPALNILINSAYRGESSARGWTSESHLLDGKRIDEATLQEYLSDENIILLKYINENGTLTGCVYLEKKPGKLYLGMLSVSPDEQANGIGRQLLHEAELVAHQLKLPVITMTVISVREELLNWYKRRGYQPTGEVLPFHIEEKFGIAKEHIQLLVLEKEI